MRRGLALASAILLTGCGRYADFTLPPLPPSSTNVEPAIGTIPDPVLPRGASGQWDGVDTLNPSVVHYGAQYFNFYSGFDGRTWHTGLATSTDGGLTWTRQGRVLSPDPTTWESDDYIAANGAAHHTGSEFLYWYQAGRLPRIGLARSSGGRQWTRYPKPVLDLGPRGSWDERGVADPYVFRTGGTFYMYYLGQDRARRQRLGLARSADGVTWTKLRANPVLELGQPGTFDELGLGEPAVWQSHGRYWMLYTGRSRSEHRALGLAYSHDGVHWTRLSEAPVFTGGQPWNAKVVCDPTILEENGVIKVWFGGGDVASPDENLHGQVGLFTLRLNIAAHATLAK